MALMPIMVPIEIIGMFTKPFALMIRLFANISAGHIIILSLISLIFIAQSAMGTGGAWGVAPVSALFVLFIYCIEVLVAFFTSIYIYIAIFSFYWVGSARWSLTKLLTKNEKNVIRSTNNGFWSFCGNRSWSFCYWSRYWDW
jgi:F0F1-type ATP synthase membrane subunit a